MILIEKTQIMGLEPAIRGMRNPMNSWVKSDSGVECTMDKLGDCLNDDYINCDDCHTSRLALMTTTSCCGWPGPARWTASSAE